MSKLIPKVPKQFWNKVNFQNVRQNAHQYFQHIWSSYMIIIYDHQYDHHIWSSYMIIYCSPRKMLMHSVLRNHRKNRRNTLYNIVCTSRSCLGRSSCSCLSKVRCSCLGKFGRIGGTGFGSMLVVVVVFVFVMACCACLVVGVVLNSGVGSCGGWGGCSDCGCCGLEWW